METLAQAFGFVDLKGVEFYEAFGKSGGRHQMESALGGKTGFHGGLIRTVHGLANSSMRELTELAGVHRAADLV